MAAMARTRRIPSELVRRAVLIGTGRVARTPLRQRGEAGRASHDASHVPGLGDSALSRRFCVLYRHTWGDLKGGVASSPSEPGDYRSPVVSVTPVVRRPLRPNRDRGANPMPRKTVLLAAALSIAMFAGALPGMGGRPRRLHHAGRGVGPGEHPDAHGPLLDPIPGEPEHPPAASGPDHVGPARLVVDELRRVRAQGVVVPVDLRRRKPPGHGARNPSRSAEGCSARTPPLDVGQLVRAGLRFELQVRRVPEPQVVGGGRVHGAQGRRIRRLVRPHRQQRVRFLPRAAEASALPPRTSSWRDAREPTCETTPSRTIGC